MSQQLGRALFRRDDGQLEYMGKVLPPGPWHDEPDHVEFRAHGFPCILHRGPLGAWCGYVGVASDHPWHGKDYGSIADPYPEVHGGLTYSEACQGPICHKPEPGEPDDLWWLGFDCNHSGDLCAYDLIDDPIDGPRPRTAEWSSFYRTVGYVRSQTERLAEQAKAAQP